MATVWELDLYSRPILDERQKRLWEVLICEGFQDVTAPAEERFCYSKYLANTEVNSIQLKQALAEALEQAPNPPSSIRFFRYQMQNMISRACDDIGIPARPSRRTLALQQWLDQRQRHVYPNHPGYTKAPSPSVAAPPPSPRPLPDALLGQQWAVVTLEASAFADMPEWPIDFADAFPLESAEVSADTPVPGILIFSPRALPLAGWLSGLELAYLWVDRSQTPRLILETGAADSWILANLTTAQTKTEAQNFEAAKQAANQVHFIGVQTSPDANAFTGFWLLQELKLG